MILMVLMGKQVSGAKGGRGMSKDWPYAKMVQDATNAGGPEKWLEAIKKASYDAGALDMKNALAFPLLAAGVGLGAVCAIGGQKIHKWITEKKKERLITAQEASEAEEYLKNELAEAVDEINNGGKIE